MSKILQLVIARAREPSSMASVAVLLGALGWNLSDEMMSASQESSAVLLQSRNTHVRKG